MSKRTDAVLSDACPYNAVLELELEMLSPAALENSITGRNVPTIKAKIA